MKGVKLIYVLVVQGPSRTAKRTADLCMSIFTLRETSLVFHNLCLRLPNTVALAILGWISLSIFPSEETVNPRYVNVSTVLNAVPSMKMEGFLGVGLPVTSTVEKCKIKL